MARRKPPTAPTLSRRSHVRRPKFRLLIFCEGKNTEPEYLREFSKEHGNDLVHIELVAPAGVPMTIIEKAKSAKKQISKSKNSFERFDQVWALFDKDEHPNLNQAITHARDANISVAFSNPCFEVWLLLHHHDFDAPDDRHMVQRKFAAVDIKYDPNGGKRLNYAELACGYRDACQRAARMRVRRSEQADGLGAPYTDVDTLTKQIVENGKKR